MFSFLAAQPFWVGIAAGFLLGFVLGQLCALTLFYFARGAAAPDSSLDPPADGVRPIPPAGPRSSPAAGGSTPSNPEE